MYKILGTKGCGKTKQILYEVSHCPNAILVCANPDAIKYKAKCYNLGEVECISYEEFLHYYCKKNKDNKFFIDEIDAFLAHLNSHIEGYTCNLE